MSRETASNWEQLAIENVNRQLGLEFRRKGFRAALREFGRRVQPDEEDEDREHLKEWLSHNKILPDGWAWKEDDLILLEVENTNALTWEKLGAYVDLFEFFDRWGEYDLGLYVCNRYGEGLHPISLVNAMYLMMRQEHAPEAISGKSPGSL